MLEMKTIALLSTVVQAMAEDLHGIQDLSIRTRLVQEWQRWISRFDQHSIYGEALRGQQMLIVRYVHLIATLTDIQNRIESQRPQQ